jgi:peroxiredoxin
VGDGAPDFTAPLVRLDGSTSPVALSPLLEDGPVLLSFYTNDFSPDCVEEWCSFRDSGWFADSDAVQAVGISKSRPYLNERFIDYFDLEVPLYSDRDLEVAEAYAVDYRTAKLLPRARRSCFLVDTDGIVRYRWLADHWLDPTLDTPPMAEIHGAIENALSGGSNAEGSPPASEGTDSTGDEHQGRRI